MDQHTCAGCDVVIPVRRKWCSDRCRCAAYRRENLEKHRERDREYARHRRASRTPEENEAYRAYLRQWRRDNPDKVRQLLRDYYLANKDKFAEARDRWRAENPERFAVQVRTYTSNRRARKRAASTFRVTPRDWDRLVSRYQGRCAYCDTGGQMTMDHVIPIARGGGHRIGNLVPACETCNKSKGPLLLIEWRYRLAVEAEKARRVSDARLVRAGVDRDLPGAA